MTDEKTRALIAELRANVELAAHGTPPTMAARIRAGESDDDRLALMVQAADALEALTVPDGDARERIAEIVYAKAEYRGDINYVSGEDKDSEQYLYCQNAADAILAAFPELSRAAAPETEWEYAVRWVQTDGQPITDIGADEADVRALVETQDGRCEGVRRQAGPWEPMPVGGETDGE